MSQYAHLSTVDPEFAALLPLPTSSPTSDINARREGIRARSREHDLFLKPRWPAESDYTVNDYKVPVEGGEIAVRCVVPSGAADGKTFPVLVWFHGGGFVVGDLGMDDYRLRIMSVEHQIAVVNVEYRLAPEHPFPASWDDTYAATKWVVANTSLLSASLPKGFVVGGMSAGGNLAASVALRARDDAYFVEAPITGQLLQIPVLVHPDAKGAEKYRSELLSMEQNKDAPIMGKQGVINSAVATKAPPDGLKISVLLHPSQADLPPAYVQVAGLDPLRDEALLYVKLLDQAGVQTKVDIYPGVPHGFSVLVAQLKISAKADQDLDEGIKWLLSGAFS